MAVLCRMAFPLPRGSMGLCPAYLCARKNLQGCGPALQELNPFPLPSVSRTGRLSFGEGFGSGEYVASNETGQPYHPSLLTVRWSQLLDELGINRVRLHDARHSCAATSMHLRQVPIAVIAAWIRARQRSVHHVCLRTRPN